MKTIKNIILFIIVAGLLVMGFFMFYTGKASQLQPSGTPQEELVKQGEYLARAGDCVACHTSSSGSGMYAGGVPLDSNTIVGVIYSTNITPDKATGIGNYTLQDFDNALRHGIRKDGASMYPAMPFPSFAITSDADTEALYAYFMNGVEPIQQANKAPSGSWPFTMRWPLNAWRMTFSQKVKPYAPPANYDATMARGAYLVQGLGHCGSCHTPRAITMQEKAYSDLGNKSFLAGAAPMEGWVAINLRGDHKDGLGGVSAEELFTLLKTGRNDTSAVFGSMSDVVNQSLQYLTDDDLMAMTAYLKSLPAVNANSKPFAYNPAVTDAVLKGDTSMVGARTYIDNCAACHRTDGKGYAQTFPALAGNPVIQSDDPTSIINIILRGDELEGTKAAPTAYTMPAFAWRLSDQEVADVATFIRTSWGNAGKPVSATSVAALKGHITAAELEHQKAQVNRVD